MLLAFLSKILSMLVRCWRLTYTTFIHTSITKNVLEYGLLLVGCGRFMIFHIEGPSNNLALEKWLPKYYGYSQTNLTFL